MYVRYKMNDIFNELSSYRHNSNPPSPSKIEDFLKYIQKESD